MKACYYSKKNRILRCLLLIVGILFCVGLITCGFFIILAYRSDDIVIVLCGAFIILVGVFMGVECLLQYRLLNRKYMVDTSGLYVQHTASKKQFYSWDRISQVCLCNIHRGTVDEIKDSVIWCTVGSIRWGPPDAKRRWNNPHYGIRYFHSVVTIEFSEERLLEFERFYSRNIADYR